MSTVEKWSALSTETPLISNAAFSNLLNNTAVTSAVFNNTQASGTVGAGGVGGDVFATLKFILVMAVGASANTGFTVWVLRSLDGGATYDSGTAVFMATQPARTTVGAPTDTTQMQATRDIMLPPGFIKFLVKNDGTGQATKTDATATGSSMTITTYSRQSV